MDVPGFQQAGTLTEEAFKQRRDSTTAQQLSALLNSSEFAAWQEEKAVRELKRKTASNVLLAAACVAFIVALAVLRPGPAPQAIPAATSTEAPASYTEAVIPSECPVLDAVHNEQANHQEIEEELYRQLHTLSHELEVTRVELETALHHSSQLGLELEASKVTVQAPASPAAGSNDPFDSTPPTVLKQPSRKSRQARRRRHKLPRNWREPTLLQRPVDNSTLGCLGFSPVPWPHPPAQPASQPAIKAVRTSAISQALLAVAVTALLGACTAVAIYLRNVQCLRQAEQCSQELKAKLNETDFARETAEQSLSLLEAELQRKVKQLDEAQRVAAAVGSPRMPSPAGGAPTPEGKHALTPRCGELPPPPALLVERFLRERNAVAIDQEQVQAWLDMEEQFSELQERLAHMQADVEAKDSQLASLGHTRDEQLAQVRSWLDEAQGELMNTQAALQEREAECKALTERVASLGASASTAADREQLLEHKMQLVQHLQKAANEQESLAQLSAAGYELARGVQDMADVASTPGDLARDVNSVLELMRQTRASLADRLAHSQQTCETMIQELQLNGARALAGDLHEGQQEAAIQTGAALPAAEEYQDAPPVLGASSRFNSVRAAAAQPSTKPAGQAEKEGESESCASAKPRAADEGSDNSSTSQAAASAWVHQLHSDHAPFDIAGFLTAVGCEGIGLAELVSREEFEAAKEIGQAALVDMAREKSAERQAIAAEAAAVLAAWKWPVGAVSAPASNPWYARLGFGL